MGILDDITKGLREISVNWNDPTGAGRRMAQHNYEQASVSDLVSGISRAERALEEADKKIVGGSDPTERDKASYSAKYQRGLLTELKNKLDEKLKK